MGKWGCGTILRLPLIIRSALTLKALPAFDEVESWLPIDTLTTIILDLIDISTGAILVSDSDTDLVYNFENPHTFSWTGSLLPKLQRSGLEFSTVAVAEWLQKLRDYENDEGSPEQDPTVKLIDHFEGRDRGKKIRDVRFAIGTAEKHSSALRQAPRLIEEGYIKTFVKT